METIEEQPDFIIESIPEDEIEEKPKKKRGRPRKVKIELEDVIPDLNEEEVDEKPQPVALTFYQVKELVHKSCIRFPHAFPGLEQDVCLLQETPENYQKLIYMYNMFIFKENKIFKDALRETAVEVSSLPAEYLFGGGKEFKERIKSSPELIHAYEESINSSIPDCYINPMLKFSILYMKTMGQAYSASKLEHKKLEEKVKKSE